MYIPVRKPDIGIRDLTPFRQGVLCLWRRTVYDPVYACYSCLIVVLATMLTRFLPFILFPAGKPTPKYIQYLGRVLPAAVFGLLVVYCLKDVSIFSGGHGLPEFIAIAVVILLHLWKRQMLLSIAGGTVCYMLLVQLVF